MAKSVFPTRARPVMRAGGTGPPVTDASGWYPCSLGLAAQRTDIDAGPPRAVVATTGGRAVRAVPMRELQFTFPVLIACCIV